MTVSGDTGHALRAAVTGLLDRPVSATVVWSDREGPIVCLSGVLEGLVELPGGEDAPLTIVIGGEDIMLWPDELLGANLKQEPTRPGFLLELRSGASIDVHPTA